MEVWGSGLGSWGGSGQDTCFPSGCRCVRGLAELRAESVLTGQWALSWAVFLEGLQLGWAFPKGLVNALGCPDLCPWTTRDVEKTRAELACVTPCVPVSCLLWVCLCTTHTWV